MSRLHAKALRAFALLCLSCPAMAVAADHVVTTSQGVVAGKREGPAVAYLGIPYAAPPVGQNRWRAPQDAPSWEGVRDASTFGSDCAQAPFPPDSAPIRTKPSEDCLFVNVWRPADLNADAKLPVMVWIHGGGFVNGGSSPEIYSGRNFARVGIVFVSLNYRLGRYGFFAHPALEKDGYGGNFGFLDQIKALEWVRDNIAAFGGDPANVTIFGESAGGMSVHMLLQSPDARGLFHKAIIQSGAGRDRPLSMPSMARAAATGSKFAPALTAEQLRALPEDVVTGNLSMMTMDQGDYSGPLVDGRTIFGSLLDAADAGLYARVPVMVGANSADGFDFTGDKEKSLAAFGSAAAKARSVYDPDGTLPGPVVAMAVSADQLFIEPARAIARSLASRQPVFHYRFGFARKQWLDTIGGTPHAAEIPYVFDTVAARRDLPMIAGEAPIATLTHRYWVNFAKSGRPDRDSGSPAWPQMMVGDTRVQIIDQLGARHVEDPNTARLDLAEAMANE